MCRQGPKSFQGQELTRKVSHLPRWCLGNLQFLARINVLGWLHSLNNVSLYIKYHQRFLQDQMSKRSTLQDPHQMCRYKKSIKCVQCSIALSNFESRNRAFSSFLRKKLDFWLIFCCCRNDFHRYLAPLLHHVCFWSRVRICR